MSREIKFRAWDHDEKAMWLFDLVEAPQFSADELKSWKVMQFTGLKDKDGELIYEGDIVRWQEESCEVRFEGGSFCINPTIHWKTQVGEELGQEAPWTWHYLIELVEDAVVIGNIHQNPELLNAI